MLKSYVVSVDLDDPTMPEYNDLFPLTLVHENNGAVQATNRAYDRTLLEQHDICIIAADDIYFPENWDKDLVAVFDQYGYDKIVKTTNQFQGNLDLINLQAAGTQFWLDYGIFYWPEYINMFADDDLTIWAKQNNRYVEARHLFFAHMQYSLQMPPEVVEKFGAIHQFDETYARENSGIGWTVGQEVITRRRQEGFPHYGKN